MTAPPKPAKPPQDHVALTEIHIGKQMREARADGVRRELPDVGKGGLRGLILVINPKGDVSWSARLTPAGGGNARRFWLGDYPAMGLGDARDAVMALRLKNKAGELSGGANAAPASMVAANTVNTVGAPPAPASQPTDGYTIDDILSLYEKSPGVTQSYANAKRTVRLVFGELLTRSEASVSPKDIRRVAANYSSVSSARLALRTLRPTLLWAEELGYAHEDISLYKMRGKNTKRNRFQGNRISEECQETGEIGVVPAGSLELASQGAF